MPLVVGSNSSPATFTSANQIYASIWKTSATIFCRYEYIDMERSALDQGEPKLSFYCGQLESAGNSPAPVIQKGKYLEFTMEGGKSKGYFYTPINIYAVEWNQYATFDPNSKTLQWKNKTWSLPIPE